MCEYDINYDLMTTDYHKILIDINERIKQRYNWTKNDITYKQFIHNCEIKFNRERIITILKNTKVKDFDCGLNMSRDIYDNNIEKNIFFKISNNLNNNVDIIEKYKNTAVSLYNKQRFTDDFIKNSIDEIFTDCLRLEKDIKIDLSNDPDLFCEVFSKYKLCGEYTEKFKVREKYYYSDIFMCRDWCFYDRYNTMDIKIFDFLKKQYDNDNDNYNLKILIIWYCINHFRYNSIQMCGIGALIKNDLLDIRFKNF